MKDATTEEGIREIDKIIKEELYKACKVHGVEVDREGHFKNTPGPFKMRLVFEDTVRNSTKRGINYGDLTDGSTQVGIMTDAGDWLPFDTETR